MNDNRVSSSEAFAILAHGTKLGKGTLTLLGSSARARKDSKRIEFIMNLRNKAIGEVSFNLWDAKLINLSVARALLAPGLCFP